MTFAEPISREVTDQLDRLDIEPGQPVIICDVDEVIVHFLRGLEDYLDRHGHWLDASSFALNGNIRCVDTNEPAPAHDVSRFILGFFDEHTHALDPIDGAVDGLRELENHAQIVLLTNLPPKYLDARTRNLRDHGMAYPVIANIGAKGPTVRHMIADHGHPVMFLDDSPSNILSVASHTPDVTLVHFLQDQRLSRVVDPMEEAHFRTDNWPEMVTYITTELGAVPASR